MAIFKFFKNIFIDILHCLIICLKYIIKGLRIVAICICVPLICFALSFIIIGLGILIFNKFGITPIIMITLVYFISTLNINIKQKCKKYVLKTWRKSKI